MVSQNRFFQCGQVLLTLASLLFISGSAQAEPSTAKISVSFSSDHSSVEAKSSKDLSNVVLKFCDGSPNYKFDGLRGRTGTFSYARKLLAGIWVKSGDNASGDGPGYGEFFPHTCPSKTQPTPTPSITHTATPVPTVPPTSTPCDPGTPTATPTPTPPVEYILICYYPEGAAEPTQRLVTEDELAQIPAKDYTLGQCSKDCMGIPGGHATIDLCGVCGGDNSTCADCAGVPNGSANRDRCGVCNGNGESCTPCGDPSDPNKVIDACGVCGGDNTTCADCLGVPNGDTKIDACGVCQGDGTSCLDCKGIPNGINRIDACGVCGGDGSTCGGIKDCTGTVDQCGVCNGNNACLDCNGVPNGGATRDCCGICGGNGDPLNCPDKCTVYDVKNLKQQLLKNVRKMAQLARSHLSRQLKCKRKNKSPRKRITQVGAVLRQTEGLIKGMIGDSIKVCDTPWCSKTDFSSVLAKIESNTNLLGKEARKAQYGSIAACGASGRGKSTNRTASTLRSALGVIRKVPNNQCSN